MRLKSGVIIRVNYVNDRRGRESDRVAGWEDDVWLAFEPASAILLEE